MPVQTYECLFLLDPNKASSDLDGTVALLTGLIERFGGTIQFCRPWGESKLAYPIGKFRKGAYVLTWFDMDSTKVPAMEAEFKLQEIIIRHLVIRHHPLIAKESLAHLRGEVPAEQPAESGELVGAGR